MSDGTQSRVDAAAAQGRQGDGLRPAATAVVVDGLVDPPATSAGPYLSTTECLGGFWVIDAPDVDVAQRLAALGSAACRSKVEVRAFQTGDDVTALLES